jgi:GNAT superfamily N-acetyltransferase
MLDMITLIRTNSENSDFRILVKFLDAELAVADGEEHLFYSQFNKIDKIKYVVIAFENDKAMGCGALKEYDKNTMEIKRMYVSTSGRGRGIATRILTELEQWARELYFGKCILETGKKQPEAIGLYKKNGYTLIPNWGQYEGIENCLCFEKVLK